MAVHYELIADKHSERAVPRRRKTAMLARLYAGTAVVIRWHRLAKPG